MKAKLAICISTFSFLLLGFPGFIKVSQVGGQVSQAQTQGQKQSDIEKLFDQAAIKHKEELHNLLHSRGGPFTIYLRHVSAKSLARLLSQSESGEDYPLDATYLDKTAVLFYSYENEILQIWLVDAHGIQAYHRRIISEIQINEAITNLRDSLGVDSLQLARSPHQRGTLIAIEKSKLPMNRAVVELTRILLPAAITNKLALVKHLIIVPVLGFGTVPYTILQPFNDGSFLIDKMSVSIAPSLFDLGVAYRRWDAEEAFSSPLIVGNPDLAKNTDWIVPPLPGAEKEAQAVAQIMNATPLIGKQATKESILSKAPNASLLYFATHGVASSINPLNGSFLMLSSKNFEQGWWTAKEIQGVKFETTQIAVLSACQTGLGKVHDAGIIGLARAFQIAGVPRVVMSLWSVNDVTTNELMQAFVKHLKDDIPVEALRKAMLEVRKQHPDPADWASFVLFDTSR